MKKIELRQKIYSIREQIEKLKQTEIELCREYIIKNEGDGERYDEKDYDFGRGKNKYTVKQGRHYWTDFFKDGDSGKNIAIERSRPVKEDGVWLDDIIKILI